jgi:competence protein ComEC
MLSAWFLCAGSVCAWRFVRAPAWVGSLMLILATGSAGMAAAAGAEKERREALPSSPNGSVRVIGIAAEDATPCVSRRGRPYFRVRLRLDSAGWNRENLVDCLLFDAGSKRMPRYGEKWDIFGRLSRGDAGGAGRKAVLLASARHARFRSQGHGSRFGEICASARRSASERLEIGISGFPEVVGVLRALLLGYSGELDRSVRDAFADTGTLHVFAISGLHVVIIAGMLMFVFSAAGIPRTMWILPLAPMLVAYTVFTGASPSAVRACVMALLYWLGPLVGRRPDGPVTLAAAALLILGYDPLQIRDLGFILSFSAVAGLMALVPVVDGVLPRLPGPDPLALPGEGGGKVARVIESWVRPLVLVSIAAWLVSAPLMLLFFGRLSIGGLLANIVIVPLTFPVLIAGCLSLVLGIAHDFLAEVFNLANVALVEACIAIVRSMAKMPGACIEAARPSAVWMAAWYCLLGYWCLVARPARNTFDIAAEQWENPDFREDRT